MQIHHSLITESEHLYTSMMHSWRSLQFRVFSILQECILGDNSELNEAVVGCWGQFEMSPGSRWIAFPEPHEHWLHTTSATHSVHFNLLSAELLVNNLPLTRLPSAYSAHIVCKTLFKECEVDVGPSREPGMMFCSVHRHHGYDIHFGLTNADILMVAKNEHSR